MEWELTWTKSDGTQDSYKSVKQKWVEEKRQEIKRQGCVYIKMVEKDLYGNLIREVPDTNNATAYIAFFVAITFLLVLIINAIYGLVYLGLVAVIFGLTRLAHFLKSIR